MAWAHCVSSSQLLCPMGVRLGVQGAAAKLQAGMCHGAPTTSPTSPRASLVTLCKLCYQDETWCLGKSYGKLAEWLVLMFPLCPAQQLSMAQQRRACAHSKSAPKTIPALPAPQWPPSEARGAGRTPLLRRQGCAHTPLVSLNVFVRYLQQTD